VFELEQRLAEPDVLRAFVAASRTVVWLETVFQEEALVERIGRPGRRWRRWVGVAASLLCLAGLGLWWSLGNRSPEPHPARTNATAAVPNEPVSVEAAVTIFGLVTTNIVR
jgi:hypothetical protein